MLNGWTKCKLITIVGLLIFGTSTAQAQPPLPEETFIRVTVAGYTSDVTPEGWFDEGYAYVTGYNAEDKDLWLKVYIMEQMDPRTEIPVRDPSDYAVYVFETSVEKGKPFDFQLDDLWTGHPLGGQSFPGFPGGPADVYQCDPFNGYKVVARLQEPFPPGGVPRPIVAFDFKWAHHGEPPWGGLQLISLGAIDLIY